MTRGPIVEDEPEFVAELRLQLESPEAAPEDVLAGALTLAALDYRALAAEYAARALRDARPARDSELRKTAVALLLSVRGGIASA